MSLHIDHGIGTEVFDNHLIKWFICGTNHSTANQTRWRVLQSHKHSSSASSHCSIQRTPHDANLYCVRWIAHNEFLRAGEMTWTVNDIINGHTDHFRNAVRSPLLASNDAACPVTAMGHLDKFYTIWTAHPPLITRSPLDGPGSEAFTREYLVQHLRELLGQLGVGGAYSGH